VRLNSYLSFNGQCESAFKFYEKCFDAKLEGLFLWGDSPAAKHVPPEWGSKVMHARLVLENGQELMGADDPPEHYRKPQGFSVSIQLNDLAKAERIFAALSDNGIVKMPLEKTFWAERFGMVTDQFGTPWMINCEQAK